MIHLRPYLIVRAFLLWRKGGGSLALTPKQEKYVQGLVAGLSKEGRERFGK